MKRFIKKSMVLPIILIFFLIFGTIGSAASKDFDDLYPVMPVDENQTLPPDFQEHLITKEESEHFDLMVNARFTPGDVNRDGQISSADARCVLLCAARIAAANEQVLSAGDVNGNGSLGASDARKILRAASRLDPLVLQRNIQSGERIAIDYLSNYPTGRRWDVTPDDGIEVSEITVRDIYQHGDRTMEDRQAFYFEAPGEGVFRIRFDLIDEENNRLSPVIIYEYTIGGGSAAAK